MIVEWRRTLCGVGCSGVGVVRESLAEVVGVVFRLAEQRGHVVSLDGVVDDVSLPPRLDQAPVPEQAQLVGHRGLRDTDEDCQVAYALGSAYQRVQNPGAGRVCQCLECLDHSIDDLVRRHAFASLGKRLRIDRRRPWVPEHLLRLYASDFSHDAGLERPAVPRAVYSGSSTDAMMKIPTAANRIALARLSSVGLSTREA